MPDDFEIGDRVLLTGDDVEMPGTVIGIVRWHEMLEPPATYKVLSTLTAMILEAHSGQLQRIQ